MSSQSQKVLVTGASGFYGRHLVPCLRAQGFEIVAVSRRPAEFGAGVSTLKVSDISEKEYVEREMVLIRIKAEAHTRAEVLRMIDIFRGKVVDVSSKSYAVEVTGSGSKIQALIDLLRPIGIKEIVRTGTIAMARASKTK